MLMGLKAMCTLSLTADELLIACVLMLLIDFGRLSRALGVVFSIRICVIKAHSAHRFHEKTRTKEVELQH